ncbi:MAG TPA: hypothetical protein VJN70_16650 [Gemmatimonadaceae bacterium]|nr:hypothetical protein [Gemmatimonadaceae bacterium]
MIRDANRATIRKSSLCTHGGSLKEIVERVLAPLIGLRLWGLSRESDLLSLQFGEPRQVGGRSVGAYTLHVACAWRVANSTTILAGSGDLFTPSDPDAELDSFDWDAEGASWWDVRMREVTQLLEQATVVSTFMADSYGGVRLVCTGGIEVELFPNSSPAPHVETEFWRLVIDGQTDDYVLVGTTGIELVLPT